MSSRYVRMLSNEREQLLISVSGEMLDDFPAFPEDQENCHRHEREILSLQRRSHKDSPDLLPRQFFFFILVTICFGTLRGNEMKKSWRCVFLFGRERSAVVESSKTGCRGVNLVPSFRKSLPPWKAGNEEGTEIPPLSPYLRFLAVNHNDKWPGNHQ